MPTPGLFPPVREFTVNYTWTDILTATGHHLFDCASFPLTGGNTYSLVQSSIATTTHLAGASVKGTCTASWVKAVDVDFDSSILQLPRSLKGSLYLNVARTIMTTETTSHETYFIAKLRKWDGSTETEIASCQSATVTGSITGANYTTFNRVGIIEVPLTLIKKGEQIRLTIELWGRRTSGANFELQLDHLPTGTYRTMAAIPFRLDFM